MPPGSKFCPTCGNKIG
ncbi:MAG: hypothetical protein IJT98_02985 [Prevotella sp.]|nr:hypothetical protein [Prevotella sp.]